MDGEEPGQQSDLLDDSAQATLNDSHRASARPFFHFAGAATLLTLVALAAVVVEPSEAPTSSSAGINSSAALALGSAGAASERPGLELPSDGDQARNTRLELFDRKPSQSVPLLVDDPQLGAELTGKEQKKLNKLAKKWAKTGGKIAKKEALVVQRIGELAAAQAALVAANALPDGTPEELTQKAKAIKKAEKKLLKAQKKLLKAQTKLVGLNSKLTAFVAAIDEVDPGYFESQTGPPPEPDPDPTGEPDPDPATNPGPDFQGAGVPTLPVFVQEARPSNGTGVTRAGDIATFGIPFSEGDVGIKSGRPALAVSGADSFQFRTLKLWPDGSVQWALCDLQTDVTAGVISQGLVVLGGDGQSVQANLADENGSSIQIDTGPLQATVLKTTFNFLDSVTVDGTLLVDGPSGRGLTGRAPNGDLLVPALTTVTLEENGPTRAMIRVDGTMVDPGAVKFVDFTLRIVARRGSRDLETQLTVRNANIARPQHAVIESLELSVESLLGSSSSSVRMAGHAGEHTGILLSSLDAHLYLAHTATNQAGLGGAQYVPHLPNVSSGSKTFTQEGYEAAIAGSTLQSLGNENLYPEHGWIDLTGPNGGVTVGIRQAPYMYPVSLEAYGSGKVTAGMFSSHNPADFTFSWQQHESRSAVFSFHTGVAADPEAVVRRLDYPVVGRFADYKDYDRAGVFPYRLLTKQEQEEALSLMGINHNISVGNNTFLVTKYLYKGTTGGTNNHAGIELHLGGDWLRHGTGGQYLSAMNLALYKSEWQVARSDNFEDEDDPGASNDQVPHSVGFQSDDEHRYRDGMILAYHLTGDRRLREALYDEAEVLQSVSLWPHERSMYQTLRAMGLVAEFTGDPALIPTLRARLQYITQPTVNVNTASSGWGWETSQDVGQRRYFVNSSDNKNEKPPGENFQCRGFISASLGPLGYFHAARFFASNDPDGMAARGRMRDLSYWAREEIFSNDPNPVNRRLMYSYAVTQQQVTNWENVDFHPILLGMAESYLDTTDIVYLLRGADQLESAQAHGDLYRWNTRMDCQHFLAIYRDWALSL